MKTITIDVGKDFSNIPQGRFYSDLSPSSGEAFREELLWPKIQELGEGEKILIILDNDVEGYGSSFLVEGFAGIVKYGYMTAEKLISILELQNTDDDFDFFKKKIIQYIKEAKFNSQQYVCTKKK